MCICAENSRRDAHLMEVAAGVGEVTARKEEERESADSRPELCAGLDRRVGGVRRGWQVWGQAGEKKVRRCAERKSRRIRHRGIRDLIRRV